MTKKQYCQTIIDKFVAEYQRMPTDGDIGISTTLAISMEVLGMLKTDAAKQYTEVRDGIKTVTERGEIITFRDFLNTLGD